MKRLMAATASCMVAALACGDDGSGGAAGPAGVAAARVCEGVHPTPPVPVADALAALDGLDYDAFVDASYEALLRRDPESVTWLGLAERLDMGNSQLTDTSATYADETHALATGIADRLRALDPSALTAAQARTRDVYLWDLDDRARRYAFRAWDYPVTHSINSPARSLLLLLTDIQPLNSVQQAEDFIHRLCLVDDRLGVLIARLEDRAVAGRSAPRLVLEWAAGSFGDLAGAPRGSATSIYTAFAAGVSALRGVSTDARVDLRARAAGAIEAAVIPAYARLVATLQQQASSAPAELGVGQYDQGEAYYHALLRHFTSTTLTADEIHALGLAELTRVHAEMRAHFDALAYPQDASLRTLYGRVAADGGAVAAGDVVQTYERLVAAAEARLSEAFTRVPAAPWQVVPVEYGGFYVAPPLFGDRPGAFYASTGAAQPRYSMASLAYHELIPGHHFQLSLAREADVPLVRRVVAPTGFVEGWALYAERLAADLGWYDGDRFSDLGRLQWEAFRAARLVMDTGLHVRGWTFTQAADFFRDNTGFPDSVISAEGQVARYIAWPAQATAYMVGMLEILRLRQQAQQALGAAFSLHGFHSAVLNDGSVPVELLDDAVGAWVDGAL